MQAIFFTDSVTGYAAGFMSFSKTTSGGVTWNNIDMPSTSPILFSSVYFLDEQNGFTSGTAAFFKTNDGGKTWSKPIEYIPDSWMNYPFFYSIDFIDKRTGMVTASDTNGRFHLYKTRDAGITWNDYMNKSNAYIGQVFSMKLSDINNGIIVDDETGANKTYTAGVYVDPKLDLIKILELEDTSYPSACMMPYKANIFVNSAISGKSFTRGQTLKWHIIFGDKTDTTFNDTIPHIPSYIAKYIPHKYIYPGQYKVKATFIAPDYRQDTLTSTIFVGNNCVKDLISGKVFYDNVVKTPITYSVVYLENNLNQKLDSAITDNTGVYRFNNVPTGTYKLVIGTTTMKWCGSNPIDALTVNRYFIGLLKTFGGDNALRETAADLNKDGNINPSDALLINRIFVGFINKFNIPYWLYETPSIIVNETSVLQDIKAICAGDVNGSYPK